MKNLAVVLSAVFLVIGISLASACGSATTPPAPTQAPPASTNAPEPTKAADPTKAPVPQPTVQPVSKSTYPEKGKPITVIVPSTAGGGSDIITRTLAPLMEKELGTPVQVVNKPGAGMQIGMTEALAAKADGYTLLTSVLPTSLGVYMDPERKSAFDRKNIQNISLITDGPFVLVVQGDGPYKTVQDLIAAAKANPDKIKGAATGYMSTGHLGNIQLQNALGIKTAIVQFEGGGPSRTALLGGHVDYSLNSLGEIRDDVRGGVLRALAILGPEESKYLPGVKTMEALGAKLYVSSSVGLSAPAGTPKEIIDTLSAAAKKGIENPEFVDKMVNRGEVLRYLTPEQYTKYWDEQQAIFKPIIEMAQQQR